MNTITISIDADSLIAAINNLAEAMRGQGEPMETPVKEHISEYERMKAEQERVIADIRRELAEERAQEAPTQTDTETAAYTVEQVREAFGELSKAKGREVAKGILSDLGVKSVSNLQPEQFVQAMQMVKEAQ